MAGIETYLEQIKNAIFGKDVRQAIHDAIEACYTDGKAGAVDLEARARIDQIVAPSGEAPSAAEVADARVVGAVTYPSLHDAINTPVTDLNDLNDAMKKVVGEDKKLQAEGTLLASNNPYTVISPVNIIKGHVYTLTLSIKTASEQPVYMHLKNSSGTNVASLTLAAGSTINSKTFTASADVENGYIAVITSRTLNYTALIKDAAEPNKNYIESLQNLVGEAESLEFEEGKYISTPSVGTRNVSTESSSLNGCSCLAVRCFAGDIFTITGSPRANSGSRPYMWLDENNQCIYRSEQTEPFYMDEIVAPENGTLVVNFLQSAERSVYKGINNLHDKTVLLQKNVTAYKDDIGLHQSKTASGTLPANTAANVVLTGLSLMAGCKYTYNVHLASVSDQMTYLHLRNSEGNILSSVNIAVGGTGGGKTYTATGDYNDAYLTIATANRKAIYKVEFIDESVPKVARLLESVPSYIVNNMAERQLGELQHPYLCLVCDDGTIGLQTYTIPMLLEKEIPCTFALWATPTPSVVLQTQEGINLVKQAINDIGCSVAQHGNVEWTEMTEDELSAFFEREEGAFKNMGITVSGAVCPAHSVNNKVRAIAGGKFGSVRSGYLGYKSRADRENHITGDVFRPYDVFTGARSNVYSYTSFNIIDVDKPIETLQTLLDTAIANNYVMIVYWHDWNFIDSDEDYLANRARLEAFIDYAKTTNVTFTTLGQIPRLK